MNTKEKIPTEEEVRRFFQESYYTTMKYNPESGTEKIRHNDQENFIYPVDGDDND